jgi:hypothetical protein
MNRRGLKGECFGNLGDCGRPAPLSGLGDAGAPDLMQDLLRAAVPGRQGIRLGRFVPVGSRREIRVSLGCPFRPSARQENKVLDPARGYRILLLILGALVLG